MDSEARHAPVTSLARVRRHRRRRGGGRNRVPPGTDETSFPNAADARACGRGRDAHHRRAGRCAAAAGSIGRAARCRGQEGGARSIAAAAGPTDRECSSAGPRRRTPSRGLRCRPSLGRAGHEGTQHRGLFGVSAHLPRQPGGERGEVAGHHRARRASVPIPHAGPRPLHRLHPQSGEGRRRGTGVDVLHRRRHRLVRVPARGTERRLAAGHRRGAHRGARQLLPLRLRAAADARCAVRRPCLGDAGAVERRGPADAHRHQGLRAGPRRHTAGEPRVPRRHLGLDGRRRTSSRCWCGR